LGCLLPFCLSSGKPAIAIGLEERFGRGRGLRHRISGAGKDTVKEGMQFLVLAV